jgi:hypothetical protein
MSCSLEGGSAICVRDISSPGHPHQEAEPASSCCVLELWIAMRMRLPYLVAATDMNIGDLIDFPKNKITKSQNHNTKKQVGEKVEAQDFQKDWYAARIEKVNMEKEEALVHFARWPKKYDEWIKMGSASIRKILEVSVFLWLAGAGMSTHDSIAELSLPTSATTPIIPDARPCSAHSWSM